MKKVIIVGGGISGLCARYTLSKRFPDAEIVLYEKSGRLGGCIESASAPCFFERGPRTFKVSRAEELLALVKELGLDKELIYSDKSARKRFLLKEGKLHKLGLFSPIIRPLLPALFREWKQPAIFDDDETIASFVTRRLGKEVAETLFEPLTQGIFAGDINTLSVRACFPELKEMEDEYGSLTRAFFCRKKTKKGKGLVTLKGGLQLLIDRLVEEGRGAIHLNTPLTALPNDPTVIALPASGARTLFRKDASIQQFFDAIEEKSIHVVNVAYRGAVLNRKGFGYLTLSNEKEKVMGVVFDSVIFPQQNRGSETRLTVMLRSGGIDAALEGLERHLGINETPKEIHYKEWKNAIPQYGVGHLDRVELFEKYLSKHYPHVTCMGNYLRGVSINHCVSQRMFKFKM